MTSTLLVLLLLSQAEGPDSPPAGAMEPPLSDSPAEVRWRLFGGGLYALGTGGTLLFPEGEGALRPGAFASMGLGVDNAR